MYTIYYKGCPVENPITRAVHVVQNTYRFISSEILTQIAVGKLNIRPVPGISVREYAQKRGIYD